MKKFNALIIGQCHLLMMPLPFLLSKSGFAVEAISYDNFLKKSRFLKKHEMVASDEELLNKLREKNFEDYDFIIPCDDVTLETIKNSTLPLTKKLQLLPVKSEKDFVHIFSKIDLSKILQNSGVVTPNFREALGLNQAIAAAHDIGYPVMVKRNSYNAGLGVFECENDPDFEKINPQIFNEAVLIQKKIEGIELDLSAIYRDGKLLYFTYSEIKKVSQNKFGPSSLRLYSQLGKCPDDLFLEMQKLGEALGANGFVTISCIQSSSDSKRYFFESDMRPNAWVEFGKYFGDYAAPKISAWFNDAQTLQSKPPINKKFPEQLLMPYFLRLSSSEILLNRHNVWKYLPLRDFFLTEFLLRNKFLKDFKVFYQDLKKRSRPYRMWLKPFSPKTWRHIQNKFSFAQKSV